MIVHHLSRWLSLLLILCLNNNQLDCLTENQIPPRFDDKFLKLDNQPENGHIVEQLGHIVKLDTLLSPNKVSSITTRFSIHNRRKSTRDIIFKPYNYSTSQVSFNGLWCE